MPCAMLLLLSRAFRDDLAALFTHAHPALFVVDHPALMGHPGGLATLGADQHRVGDVNGHGFVDHAALASLALRFHMLFDHVQALDHDFFYLWQGFGNRSLFALIFASE